MNNFALEIFDDEGQICTFYTVRWVEEEISETEKFYNRYKDNSRLIEYLQQLSKFIVNTIGNEYGAIEYFFRHENNAMALPPKRQFEIDEVTINYRNFPLRLYCLRMNKNLVILFNGARKTSQRAQEGETAIYFHEANNFAKRIMEALRDGEIFIDEKNRKFISFNKEEMIII